MIGGGLAWVLKIIKRRDEKKKDNKIRKLNLKVKELMPYLSPRNDYNE